MITTILCRMTDAIRHRGPDDEGAWYSAEHGVALGFRRLAILDLSPAGHQPMLSPDSRYVIAFNGEIYNFGSLREELLAQGHTFRGTSDTEVMLAAICHWGLTAAVQRFNGMFAFALWDTETRSLHLVRDRMGVKPLYYGWLDKTLVFASELKSLRAYPAFQQEIDRGALALYLRYSYIPAPFTIYQGIYKLEPGHILTVKSGADVGDARKEAYWSARAAVENGIAHPFEGDALEALEALDSLLTRSVGLRMIADVPLGAFLSGGVDSSTIIALMQKQNRLPVRTFTIGFHEAGYDEARHALAVAQHLGAEHTELYITSDQARAVIPRLPTLYDEPFADPSQIPTLLISELARRHVTVSLSGDGGDELFGGYNRYLWSMRIWNMVGWAPLSWRRAAARGLSVLNPVWWGKILAPTGLPNPSDKIHKIAEVIRASTREGIYFDLVSHWKHPHQVVIGGQEPLTALIDSAHWVNTATFAERMMSLDLITYLPDDILAKVDRASMGVSLEARVPYIDDHEVVEFAWKLPIGLKIRGGQSKWILRQLLYRYVPPRLIKRPKMGFSVPIDAWLRGPLREWGEELLEERRLRREGYLQPELIRQRWKEHLSSQRNWQYCLWNILMFQAWMEAQQK